MTMATVSPIGKVKTRSKCRDWRIFVSCGKDEHGRRIQRSKRVHGMTYSEAREESIRYENELLGVTSRDCTFAEFAQNWLARRKPTWRESTYLNRKSVVQTLTKVFGTTVKLSALDAPLIERKLNGLLEKGNRENTGRKPCKPSYVASLHTYMYSIMQDGVDLGVITRNPCTTTKRPPSKAEKREAPTMQQLADLVDDMDVTDKHEMAIVLQCLLGIRRGESLALRWQDVDFERGIIHIRHSLAPNCVLTPPKTKCSYRDLPMPELLRDKLLMRREVVKRGLKRAVRGGMLDEMPKLDDVFVVCDEMGRPCGPGSQTCWWAHHRDRFGMSGYVEHDLRHGYLTALARSGVHPTVAQALAGHEKSSTTMEVYTSVDMDAKVGGAAIFDDAIAALIDNREE